MSLTADPRRPENLIKWVAAIQMLGRTATVVTNDHTTTATGVVTQVGLTTAEAQVQVQGLTDPVPLSHVRQLSM